MPRFFAARVLFGPQGAQEMAAMPDWSPSVDIVETPEEYLTSPFKVAARPHPALPRRPSPDGERGSLPVFQAVFHLSANEAPSPRRERGRTEVEGEVARTAVLERFGHLERGGG